MRFVKGDWVSNDADRIAQVRCVHTDSFGDSFDLVMYDREGNRIGRVSPPLDGPRTFEPCCSMNGWFKIKKPEFPVQLRRMRDGTVRYWAGDRITK